MFDSKASRPLLYAILGTPGSRRRAGLLDLIENDPTEVDSNIVLMSREDVIVPEARALNDLPNTQLIPWNWENDTIACSAMTPGAGSEQDRIFYIAEPLRNPVDQMEALVAFAEAMDLRIGRVLTWVDCATVSQNEKPLEKWLDACVHFSDCVILSKREDVSGKWLKSLENRYRKAHLPCLFFHEKKKGFDNPALVLEPSARRASLAFDEVDPMFEDDPDIEDEPDLVGEVDPYFERMVSGRREKLVPEIRELGIF